MEGEYCGLYIDSMEIVFCRVDAKEKIINTKYLWYGDYFKLDSILKKYEENLGKVILSFDEDINSYEKLHIIDMIENKDVEIINISHKFISFMLAYIFENWQEKEKEICPIDAEKNYLIMDLGYSAFKVGVFSVKNFIKKMDYELLAYSVFDIVNTKLIYNMLIDYIYNINNLKNNNLDLLIFNGDKRSNYNREIDTIEKFRSMKIKKEIEQNIIKSIPDSVDSDLEINLEGYGIDNIYIKYAQFENNILSLLKTNIKGLIEEFYLDHKNILEGKYIDRLIFLGDFNRFPYLANYIISLFHLKIEFTFIENNFYGAFGALLYGLIDMGEIILPFSKENIIYAGEDIYLYQKGKFINEYVKIIEKSTRCPYEGKKFLFLDNVIENPIKLKIARTEDDELYTIQDLDIYLPFSYYGDNMEIKTHIDENRNVDGIISHKRTGEEILFNFSL